MKKSGKLLVLGTMVMLFLVGGCKKDDDASNPQEEQLKKMAGTWKVASDAGAVTFNGDNAVKADYEGMTLTLTEQKGYSTTNIDSKRPEVWKSSGTFEFEGSSIQRVIRDGKVPIDIVLNGDASRMTLSFELNESNAGGRLAGFKGSWVFVFTK